MGKSIIKKYFLVAFGIVVLLSTSFTNQMSVSAESSEEQPKYEMRAAWISTVTNIDLQAGMTEEEYRNWAEETVSMLKSKNFNTIIFQVKPTSDALYPSELAPWSKYITGQEQGTDPGYDPLEIMLQLAHENGLELHAWINPYRVTMPSDTFDDLHENNIAVKNEDWVVEHGTQLYLDPGIPEVSEYLVDTVEEIVMNYDIDAVHMDDYFYPGSDFEDEETYEKYGEDDYDDIGDWRRDNVNKLVSNINHKIKELKPWVQFGISPSGIWRNKSTDPEGSDTAGSEHYDNLYADSRQWIIDDSIDYITPQIYWSRELEIARYDILAEWWGNLVDKHSENTVNLYIGMADYKVGGGYEDALDTPDEIYEQILDNRNNSSIKGQMHFTLRDIKNDKLGYQTKITEEAYNYKSLTNPHSWNGNSIPNAPTQFQFAEGDNEFYASIFKDEELVRKYVVYKFDDEDSKNYDDPNNIEDILYATDQGVTFSGKLPTEGETVIYGVKSVSNTGIESEEAYEFKVPQIFVDKTKLAQTIEESKDLEESHYEKDSWKTFFDVLKESELVLEDEDALQNEVDEILSELEEAIQGLVVDKEELKEIIFKAKELNSQDYTEESWEKLLVALDEGQQILDDADAKYNEVEKAITQIKNALDELVEYVDKKELQDKLSEAESIEKNKYTKESYEKFAKALEQAKVVLEDEDATNEEVQAALENLKNKMEQLESVDKEEPSTPKVDETTKDEKEEGSKLPKTATNHYNFILLGVAFIIASMFMLVIMRKKTEKN